MENAKLVAREGRWTQQKFLKGIVSLGKVYHGFISLHNFNQLEY